MDELIVAAEGACAAVVAALGDAGVPAEGLAEYIPERRVLLIRRPATMRSIGEVWRLGPLLLGTDASLFAAGRATRAAERGRPSYQSLSREERRDIAAAALRGGYPEGAPVNFDAVPLTFEPSFLETLQASAPIGVFNGAVRVRWRPGAPLDDAPTLGEFLAERAELLIG